MRNRSEVGRDVLERAGRGDGVALEALYRAFGAKLHAIAFRITASREDAEDVVHDLFVGLPRAIRTFDGSGTFDAWIRAIAVRHSLMLLRRRRTRGEVVFEEAAGRGDVAAAAVARVDLAKLLGKLPSPLRTVIVLKEVEGFSHAEIGDLLGISAANSMVRCHRARRQLRRLLKEASQ